MAAWNTFEKFNVSNRRNLLCVILLKSSNTNGPDIPGRNTRVDIAASNTATTKRIFALEKRNEVSMGRCVRKVEDVGKFIYRFNLLYK